MTEPQSWVLIGVFTTIMLGGMSIMTVLINRSIDGLRHEVNGRIDGLSGEMNARFDAVNVRMDSLDKDVAALVKRVMG